MKITSSVLLTLWLSMPILGQNSINFDEAINQNLLGNFEKSMELLEQVPASSDSMEHKLLSFSNKMGSKDVGGAITAKEDISLEETLASDISEKIKAVATIYYGYEALYTGKETLLLDIADKANEYSDIFSDNFQVIHNSQCHTIKAIANGVNGQPDKELHYFQKALDLNRERSDHHPDMDYRFLNNLAVAYKNNGQIAKAEAINLENLIGTEKNNRCDKFGALYNLGGLYADTGVDNSALEIFEEGLTCIESLYGKSSPLYVQFYRSYIQAMIELNPDKALSLTNQNVSLAESINGKLSSDTAFAYYELGDALLKQVNFKSAREAYNTALDILDQMDNRHSPIIPGIYHSLASILFLEGKYEEAIHQSNVALEKYDQNVGELHLVSLGNRLLKIHSQSRLNGKVSDDVLKSSFKILNLHLESGFEYLSVDEKEQLIRDDNDISIAYSSLIHYILHFQLSDYNDLLYDLALSHKSALLRSEVNIAQISKEHPELTEDLEKIRNSKTELNQFLQQGLAEAKIDSVQSVIALQEKALARASSSYSEDYKYGNTGVLEIRQNLKDGEAAIEFVSFRKAKKDAIIAQGNMDEYLAAIITFKDKPTQIAHIGETTPLLKYFNDLSLKKGTAIEELYAPVLRGVKIEKEKLDLYGFIWEPLVPHLNDINKIYYSPVSLLHRLNLSAIPIDEFSTLIDKYDLIEVSSTKNISRSDGSFSPKDMLIVSDVDYGSDLDNSIAARGPRTEKWSSLKWTKKEAQDILSHTAQIEIKTTSLSKDQASEETIKKELTEGTSPSVIHFATHGFFYPDPSLYKYEDDELIFKTSSFPLMRTGLVLADGNKIWNGVQTSVTEEDGILTAQEISAMDLSNTDLVVLSACETGLGDLHSTEGVYGLQRAFKKAGAKYLIAALWQVPDRETSVFMDDFYKNLFSNSMSIPDAFYSTQKTMKERFFNPFEWAGFVLIE